MTFTLAPMLHQAMYASLNDPTLVFPDTTRIFPPAQVDIRLGGDASIAGSDRQITIPLQQIVITIGWPYGSELGARMQDQGVTNLEQAIKLTVWSNSAADSDNMMQRLEYIRDVFPAVFSSRQVCILGGRIQSRMRPYSPVEGLVVFDTTWNCLFERRNS